MYVHSMYVNIYVCKHVCMHTCMYARMYVCMYVYAYAHVCKPHLVRRLVSCASRETGLLILILEPTFQDLRESSEAARPDEETRRMAKKIDEAKQEEKKN